MGRLLRIRVRRRLQRNLSTEEGRPVRPPEVEQLLIDAGFTPDENGAWIVREEVLGHLSPSEVSQLEILEEPRK
jgi:hypothetical protein